MSSDFDRLAFRRQYLIAPGDIECPFLFNRYIIDAHYFLYSHIDLNVTQYAHNKTLILLIGDLFDFEFPTRNNLQILESIFDENFSVFLSNSSRCAGRFVLIHISRGEITIANDATASRKVYYANYNSSVWCSSNPHLLAKVLNLDKTHEPSKLRYYRSQDYKRLQNSNPGNTTPYESVFQLIPNFYLNFTTSECKRFWPNEKIMYSSVDEMAGKVAEMTKGYIQSINQRFDIMLPVTAGKDSRILLAAVKEIRENVYYYINRGNLKPDSNDIKIPKKMLSKLSLVFNVLNSEKVIDEKFKKIYFENYNNASTSFLPIIYNYYKNFQDKINMPGIFAASAFEVFGSDDKNLSGEVLSKMNNLHGFSFAQNYYNNWYNECKDLCNELNFNVLALFYIEERLANWGTQILQFKDIAQEEFVPFNSRLLIKYCFSIEPVYLNKSNQIFFKKIIQYLWPETLSVPINPSFKKVLLETLHVLRMEVIFRKIQRIIKLQLLK